jgi:D-arabinose 5-phosphate isomerase GutQ
MVQQCSQQRPVQNSEVYVLRQVPPFPALSPPSPITPAEDFDDTPDTVTRTQPDITICAKRLAAIEERLSRAVHVLATETTALQNLTELYSSDRVARDGFTRAVDAIIRCQGNGGKLVVIGVGKSGHIAKKLVATFNSLAIQAVFLHPTEALHGDLGQISRNDALLLITFSGKTPELLALLPHLDTSLPLILLTAHTRRQTCELIRHRPDTILLPAPVHEPETVSFGVAAPTTSTTVALTVGDALAMVASRELHPCVPSVFARNHPGGAIGAALWKKQPPRQDVRSVMVPLSEIPLLHSAPPSSSPQPPASSSALPSSPAPSSSSSSSSSSPSITPPTGTSTPKTQTAGLDVLKAGYASPSGWLQLPPQPQRPGAPSGGVISPRKIRRLSATDMSRPLEDLRWWLVTPRGSFIPVAADTSVQRAAEWIRGLRAATASTNADAPATGGGATPSASAGGKQDGEERIGKGGGREDGGAYGDEAIVAVMERGECVGLLEVGRLLEAA